MLEHGVLDNIIRILARPVQDLLVKYTTDLGEYRRIVTPNGWYILHKTTAIGQKLRAGHFGFAIVCRRKICSYGQSHHENNP